LSIIQNVHTNANIPWDKIVLCAIVGKQESSNAEFQGSVAFAGLGNEKIV